MGSHRKKQDGPDEQQTATVVDEESAQWAQGIAETKEQINDTFLSGHEDVFLRADKERAKRIKKDSRLNLE